MLKLSSRFHFASLILHKFLGLVIYLSSVNKVAHSGFETHRGSHQKSKTGVSVAPQKDLCPPKVKIKRFLTYCTRNPKIIAFRKFPIQIPMQMVKSFTLIKFNILFKTYEERLNMNGIFCTNLYDHEVPL